MENQRKSLLRHRAREVGPVGAEHAGHVLLPHSQELLRRVVLVGLLWEGFLHEEALAAHGLVAQEGVLLHANAANTYT